MCPSPVNANQEDADVTCIVSCDIVGHGDATRDVQRSRLVQLNDIVRNLLGTVEGSQWASSGDGGHLLLPASIDRSVVVGYVEALQDFRRSCGIQLRVCFHAGPTGFIDGANGQGQPYGESINTAGHLVMVGDGTTMYATAPFIEWFGVDGNGTFGLRFSDQTQVVYLKRGRPHTIRATYTATSPDVGDLVGTDRTGLRSAKASGPPWSILYHARRLLQSDSNDAEAVQALHEVRPGQLLLATDGREEAHPVFSVLNVSGAVQLVRQSALVERDAGEYFCLLGDAGDAMFIVLKGEVGVVTPSQVQEARLAPGTDAAADIRYGPGAIVGELALAFHRERTASLQATVRSAVLAIDRTAFYRLTDQAGRPALEQLLLGRGLEHVSRHASDLAAPGDSPLSELSVPWAYLEPGAELLSVPADTGEVLAADQEPFGLPGLYILASGTLVDESTREAGDRVTLEGTEFPLVWVNIPRHIRRTTQRFIAEPTASQSHITMIRIRDEAILRGLPPDRRAPVLAAVRRQLARQLAFDVFVSYSGEFVNEASHLSDVMTTHGLKVFFQSTQDRSRRGVDALNDFNRDLAYGINESIVFVCLISQGSASEDGTTWMQREIAMRRQVFPSSPNILPVVYERGILDEVADGFQAISAIGTIEAARSELMETVTAFVGRCRETGEGLPLNRNDGS